MKQGLYAIYDTVATAIHGGVMMFTHDAPAMRFFEDLYKDNRTQIAKHPGDHKLIHIGNVDDETGDWVEHDSSFPRTVLSGQQLAALNAAPGEAGVQPAIDQHTYLKR